MEAPEVPLEQTTEHIHEHAHHSRESWTMKVALSTAILAALAAVTSLLAGHHANEAMVEQLKASDNWAYYQAKGIKANLLASKMELLKALDKPANPKDDEKLKQYKEEQEKISETAKEGQAESKNHLEHHVIFARGVTLFQVAIAISAVAVLTKRRRYWYFGMFLGVAGIFFLIQGFVVK